MTAPGRIPCINPRCRRTASDDGETEFIVCGKCWRTLPTPLCEEWKQFKARDKRLRRLVDRRIKDGSISQQTVQAIGDRQIRHHDDIWRRIRAYFETPVRPTGLERFLREVGL